MKFTLQAAANDHLSVRYSKQNAEDVRPGIFGIYGGLKPFRRIRHQSDAQHGHTYNRVWSASLVQEVRIGRTSHHNEAISEAHGLKTSEQLGIRGVNLNEFTSGISTIDLTTAYSEYFIGFETSLPWDRRADMDLRYDRDQIVGQSHHEDRRRPSDEPLTSSIR
jgi:hypothetical protein